MILVKSLIVLFIILILFKYSDQLMNLLASIYDAREGFAAPMQKPMQEPEPMQVQPPMQEQMQGQEEEKKELKFTEASEVEKHKLLEKDAKLLNELQESMKDLMELNTETNKIKENMQSR